MRRSAPLALHPSPVGKYDRRLDLSLGDRPVRPEQAILVAVRDDRESVPPIERDGPRRIRPGPDQDGLVGEAFHVAQESRSHALPLCGSRDIRVRSEEHTSELQSPMYLVCRLLLEKKKQ